jgi:hypothetical protein
VFERRFQKHQHPARAAAYVLDPLNAFKAEGSDDVWYLPVEHLDVETQLQPAVKLIARITGSKEEEAKAEMLKVSLPLPGHMTYFLDSIPARKVTEKGRGCHYSC